MLPYSINFRDAEQGNFTRFITFSGSFCLFSMTYILVPIISIYVKDDFMKKRAFTLAETLITLLVIGIVAALTIPSLMQNINEYTLGKQRDVFEKKFHEGLRQMRVVEKLSEKYATTEDFVNEMGKYFKI